MPFAEVKGAKSIADLRAMSWQKLTEPLPGATGSGRAAPAIPGGGRGSSATTSPVVDGYVLPAAVREVVAQGKHDDVPVLTGVNAGELGGLMPSRAAVTLDSFRYQAYQRYGDDADRFLTLYPASNDEEAAAAQAHTNRDQSLVSLWLWAKQRSQTSKTKVVEYLFDHPMPGPESARYGAFHTGEVPYVLNTLYASPRTFADIDHKIVDMMSSYWVNFATKGVPNGKGLPLWPCYGDKGEVMELGDKNAAIPVAGIAAKQAFFEAYLTRP